MEAHPENPTRLYDLSSLKMVSGRVDIAAAFFQTSEPMWPSEDVGILSPYLPHTSLTRLARVNIMSGRQNNLRESGAKPTELPGLAHRPGASLEDVGYSSTRRRHAHQTISPSHAEPSFSSHKTRANDSALACFLFPQA